MIRAFTKDELQKLLAVAKNRSAEDALMFLVSFNHGLRVSEVLNLTAENIQGDLLVVQRLKGSEKTAQPMLPNEREQLLALASKGGKFFPICRMTAHRRIRRYCSLAGIPAVKARMHALKHTCGTLGYNDGHGMSLPEVQTYLGHKSGSNTMVYLRASEEKASKAFAAAVGI